MNALSFPDATIIELSEAERSALVWAIEVARALRLDNADVRVLLADPSVSPELLDALADCLVAAGTPRARIDARVEDWPPILDPPWNGMVVRRDDGADVKGGEK